MMHLLQYLASHYNTFLLVPQLELLPLYRL